MRNCVWLCRLRILRESISESFSLSTSSAFKFHDIDTWCCKAESIIYSMKINSTMVTRLVGHYRHINRSMLMNL